MSITTTTAYAFATDDVTDTAVALVDFTGVTDAILKRASRVRMTAIAQPANYRYDGTAPTAAIGHIIAAGETVFIVGNENIRRLSFIRNGGTSGTLSVTFEE